MNVSNPDHIIHRFNPREEIRELPEGIKESLEEIRAEKG
jgi:hypothetical protein